MLNLPYMGGYPQKVVGDSSNQPTLFGVLGMIHENQKYQALQQVVQRPAEYKVPHLISEKANMHTDRGLLGPPAKTHIPGLHHSMVPFAGRFMSEHGNVEIYNGRHHKEEHHKEEHHKEEHHHKK